jgi:hypothetical protein
MGEGGLLAVLLREIENCIESPREAYLAAKCLLVMATNSAEIRSKLFQMGALRVISEGQVLLDSYLLFKNAAVELLSVLKDNN